MSSNPHTEAATPAVAPLLVGVEDIVRMKLLPTSVRTWRRLDAAGQVPQAIILGRRKVWRLSDLRQWAELGCPDRQAFEAAAARDGI